MHGAAVHFVRFPIRGAGRPAVMLINSWVVRLRPSTITAGAGGSITCKHVRGAVCRKQLGQAAETVTACSMARPRQKKVRPCEQAAVPPVCPHAPRHPTVKFAVELPVWPSASVTTIARAHVIGLEALTAEMSLPVVPVVKDTESPVLVALAPLEHAN